MPHPARLLVSTRVSTRLRTGGRALALAAVLTAALASASGCSHSDKVTDADKPAVVVTDPAAAFPDLDLTRPNEILAAAAENLRAVTAVRIQTTGGGKAVPTDIVVDKHGIYMKGHASGEEYEAIVLDGTEGYLRAGADFWQAYGLDPSAAAHIADVWVHNSEIPHWSTSTQAYLTKLSTQLEAVGAAGKVTAEFMTLDGHPTISVDGTAGTALFAGDPLLPRQLEASSRGTETTATFTYEDLDPVVAPDHPVDITALTD